MESLRWITQSTLRNNEGKLKMRKSIKNTGNNTNNSCFNRPGAMMAMAGLFFFAFSTFPQPALAKSYNVGIVKKGAALFEENCEVCHQADAIGEPGTAPSLTNQELLSISSDKFLMGTIRDGREDTSMMPFDHLKRSEAKAIVIYLRSHQELPDRSKEIDAQPEARGDPRLGEQWYNSICSTCHGISGDGYNAGGTGTAIGLSGFLSKASDGFIRETIKKGRSNTRMLGFQGPAAMANLNDQEIDDIIVYLRQLAQNQ